MQEDSMQPKTAERFDWPVIVNVIAPLAAWWRRRSMAHENLESLSAFSPAEMDRIAQDVGLSSSELWTLAAHSPDEAELLQRRLAAVGLDPKELAQSATTDLRDMERLCTLCGSKVRCSHDLAAAPRDPAWRKYCPNEATITQLAHDHARASHP
jgi:hypothetical protein